jgi:hypothetical protein
MRHLSIFFIIVLIYPYVSFAEINYTPIRESGTEVNVNFLDSLEIINLIPVDSITPVPGNQINKTLDTTRQITNEPVKPILENNFQNFNDTTKQHVNEPTKLITDTNNLLINDPILIPSDSTGLIQMEKNIPSDSLGLILKENIIPGDTSGLIKVQKLNEDSVNVIKIEKRIEFRSVYTDSTDINYKPPRKIIMFQWISDEKRDTVIRYKNIMGFNMFYGIYTYGLGFGIFRRISNDADFIANVNLSYVFDRHNENEIDSSMNVTYLRHESRMYPIIFNVGLEKYFMQNRVDWNMKPILIFGFTPAIVITTPYELTFFRSLKKIQLAYGMGVFAAVGFDWQAFKKVGINLTARYSFIPLILGKEIYYYTGFKVKNIGGFYVNLGITLLKEYFGRK